MIDGKLPDATDLERLDAALAAEGVSVLDRPDQAMFRWAAEQGRFPGDDFSELSRWFTAKFSELHSSVDFANPPFALLCVSAYGVAYQLDPPFIIGPHEGIDPLRHVRIAEAELRRISSRDQRALWEMRHQAADGIDFFMGNLVAPALANAGGGMMSVGYSHLEAAARQLVAGAADSSLPHAMSVAAETVTKAVLCALGMSTAEVAKFGHRLADTCRELAQRAPSTSDDVYIAVAGSLPKLVEARYSPIRAGPLESQDLFRRTMFLCAEAVRRLAGPAIRPVVSDWPGALPRAW